MKPLPLSLLVAFFCCINYHFVFSQNKNQVITRANGQKDLLGLCDRTALQKEPFEEWMEANYTNYQPDQELLAKWEPDWEGLRIDVFMGTWCGDSRREVPRFYKILDEWSSPAENIRLINVDKTPEAYKKSPTHEEQGKLIHRVPTFIVYRNGEEIGRIVESPVTSLEMDLLQILKGFPSSPNYKIVNQVDAYFEAHGIPEENTDLLQLARQLYKLVWSDKELNTYGYYLLYQGEVEKAIAAFKLNTMYFRDLPNVYDSLGEAYMLNEKLEEALKMYQKVLSMEDENENAQKQIQLLQEKLKEKDQGKS